MRQAVGDAQVGDVGAAQFVCKKHELTVEFARVEHGAAGERRVRRDDDVAPVEQLSRCAQLPVGDTERELHVAEPGEVEGAFEFFERFDVDADAADLAAVLVVAQAVPAGAVGVVRLVDVRHEHGGRPTPAEFGEGTFELGLDDGGRESRVVGAHLTQAGDEVQPLCQLRLAALVEDLLGVVVASTNLDVVDAAVDGRREHRADLRGRRRVGAGERLAAEDHDGLIEFAVVAARHAGTGGEGGPADLCDEVRPWDGDRVRLVGEQAAHPVVVGEDIDGAAEALGVAGVRGRDEVEGLDVAAQPRGHVLAVVRVARRCGGAPQIAYAEDLASEPLGHV